MKIRSSCIRKFFPTKWQISNGLISKPDENFMQHCDRIPKQYPILKTNSVNQYNIIEKPLYIIIFKSCIIYHNSERLITIFPSFRRLFALSLGKPRPLLKQFFFIKMYIFSLYDKNWLHFNLICKERLPIHHPNISY